MLIHITKMKTKTAGPNRAGSGDRLAWNSNGSPDEPDPSEHETPANELRESHQRRARQPSPSASSARPVSDETLFN